VRAITRVYNFSYPLAIVLALGGFMTCGKLSFQDRIPSSGANISYNTRASFFENVTIFLLKVLDSLVSFIPSWTLDLDALKDRGSFKLTHDASFVHPDAVRSTTPDPHLVRGLLDFASTYSRRGLRFIDVVRFHASRGRASSTRLSDFHNTVALGECALTWLTLRGKSPFKPEVGKIEEGTIIPTSRLEQWFGEERLPDGWWGVSGVRPLQTVGLLKARSLADTIGRLAEKNV